MARCPMMILAGLALGSAAFAQTPAPLGAGGTRPGLSANVPAALPPVPGTLVRPRRDNPVVSIQEFVRLEGQMTNTLRGIGIVTGLKGTGDDGKELLLARPLAEVYRNNGNPIGELRDLAKSKAAAIVTLSVTLPEGGGREGDPLDVFVQVSHSAASLKGGTLIISPLLGPTARDSLIYALASGPIVLEDAEVPTTGRIRGGAVLTRDVRPAKVGDEFNLILRPHFRSYQMSRTITAEINDLNANLDSAEAEDVIATAVDETMVHVSIPRQERANPTNFMANVLSKKFSPSLIDLPAMVVVNERTGSIIVTGNVEISAVTVGNDRLFITTTTPAPSPTAQDPLVVRQNWAEFGTTGTNSDRGRIQDLLEAFKQLSVPIKEQISILAQIDQAGRLNARFVRE